MVIRFASRVAVCAALLVAMTARADDAPAPAPAHAGPGAIISQQLQLGFAPATVYFFVDSERGPQRVAALFVPLPNEPADSDPAIHHWLAGAKIELPSGVTSASFSTLVLGGDGQALFLPASSADFAHDAVGSGLSDAVRSKLLERKEVLRSFELQRTAQQESLDRLRADAEVIANLGRILELRDDLERTESDRISVDKDLETLSGFSRLARARPAPSNFVGRERQLVRQLNEIAEASRAAETDETSRRSRWAADLQRRLAVVEATRFDNFDDLQEQLTALRRRRAQLERELGKQPEDGALPG